MKVSEMLREGWRPAPSKSYLFYLQKGGEDFLKEVENKIKPYIGNKIKTQVGGGRLSGKGKTKDGQEAIFELSISPGDKNAVLRFHWDNGSTEGPQVEYLKTSAGSLTVERAADFFSMHWM